MKKVKKSSIRFTHMSFPVRTCIGVLPGRELESAEAATLSFAFREDLLEEAATCLDKWSFFVMVGVEWQRASSEGGVRGSSLGLKTRRVQTFGVGLHIIRTRRMGY